MNVKSSLEELIPEESVLKQRRTDRSSRPDPVDQRLIRTSGGQVSTLVPATVGDVADRGFSGCLPAFNGDDGPLHAPQYQVPS